MSAGLAHFASHLNDPRLVDPWLPWGTPRADAQIRIFCLPYAGGGASIFRETAAALPREIDLCPIQLPGREGRIGEAALRSLGELTPALMRVLRPYCERPFALLGYSMGALVAYDLAAHLAREGLRQPDHLIVCTRRGPNAGPSRSGADLDTDAGVVARLRTLGGTPETVFGHAELLSLLMPALKADFAVNASFAGGDLPSLQSPVLAVGGLGDPEVRPEDLEDWATVTSGRFALRHVRGGHFFIREYPAEFAAVIARAVLTQD